jgi:hypothetical protein
MLGNSADELAESKRGQYRRRQFQDALAKRIQSGRVGSAIGGEKGILASKTPPLSVKRVDGTLRFELTPHFGIHDDVTDEDGGRTWQISS